MYVLAKHRIKDAEATLDRLRKEIQAIDQRLADGELYLRNPAEAARLAKSRSEATRSVTATEETWLTLAAELEAAGS